MTNEDIKLLEEKTGKKWLSMQEASKRCSYSQEYLSLLARRGKILSQKIGRNWYTTEEALRDYLQKQNLIFALPKKIIGRLAAQAGLTPEEPEKGEPVGHEGHSKIFEEYEQLNPALFQKGGASPPEKEKTFLGKITPLSPLPESKDQNDVLNKLDRLSGSLEFFAEQVTKKLDQPQPSQEFLTPKQEEFFNIEIPSFTHRFKIFDRYARSMMRNPVRMMTITITAIVAIFIIAGGFSFGQADYVVQQIKKAFTDADTLQGHFPGTHANEVLVLDKAGNVSIFGHIETQGQLRSFAPDGVAPIVVDSMMLVENLNAEYFDSLASKDFTLAFVTKNGNLTYEDVYLEGNVEVGKTLTVKGAAKLLDSLQVYGTLGVFSDAIFGKNITLTAGNLILKKGTIEIFNTSLIKNLNAEFLDGLRKNDINLDFVTSNGASTGNGIAVGGLEVNGQSDFNGMGFFHEGVWGSDGAFGTLGVAGGTKIGNSDKSYNSLFEVYSKYFKVDQNGNATISGSTSTSNLITGSVESNLISSGSYDLGSSGSPWDELFASSASFSIITITGTGGGNFEGTTSSSFRINTDNVSSDSEDSYLSFERGTTIPNAIIQWDSINKQFNFNQPVKIASTSFELVGTASISGDLILNGSGAASGRLQLGRAPTAPHTGTWPSFGGLDDATLLINPLTSVADGNLIAVTIGGAARFVVDNEGDVYAAGNLILSGTTTQSTTNVTGDLNVEGNTRLGDALSDRIRLVGTILPYTLTSDIMTIQASPSWEGDYYTKITDSSSNPIFMVASSGNVGIGTTVPVSPLHIYGSSGAIIQTIENAGTLQSYTNYKTDATLMYVGHEGNTAGQLLTGDTANSGIINMVSSQPIYFGTNDTVRMTILGTGYVGIGTTGPIVKLNVSGGTGDATTYDPQFALSRFSSTGNNEVFKFRVVENVSSPTNYGDLSILRKSTPSSGEDDSYYTSALYIDGRYGNVGIGTTTPLTTLQVVDAHGPAGGSVPQGGITVANVGVTNGLLDIGIDGSGTFYSWLQSRSAVAATYYNLVLNPVGGNVGIGTTAPTTKLDVIGNASVSLDFEVGGRLIATTFGSNSSISGNFDPATDNTYSLGNTSYRWKDISVGPGSFKITSTTGTSGAGADYTLGQIGFTGSSLSFGTYDQGAGNYGSLEFKTASTSRMFISSSGNVGIGTTTPLSKLYVEGASNTWVTELKGLNSVALNAITGLKLKIGYAGEDNKWAGIAAVSEDVANLGNLNGLALYSGEAEHMRITDAGNVGIGDSSPEQKLTVSTGASGAILASGSVNVDLILKSTSATGAATEGQFTIRSAGSSERLDILNNTTALMTIASTGFVGIGTTSPTAQLTVDGTGQTTANITDAGVMGATLKLIDEGYAAGSGGAVLFGGKRSSYFFAGIKGLLTDGTSNSIGDLAFSTRNATGDTALTERMRILASGNVGIGTTGPEAVLTVKDNGTSGSVVTFLRQDDDNTYGLVINNAAWSGTVTNGLRQYVKLTGTYAAIDHYESGGATLSLNPSGGNVGIGNTSPDAKLDVTGNIYASSSGNIDLVLRSSTATADDGKFTIRSTGASDRLEIMSGTTPTSLVTIASTGNVGIGTTVPLAALHIKDSGNLFMGSLNNAGVISFRSDLAGDTNTGIGAIDHSGSNNDGLALYGGDGISFHNRVTTGHVEYMRITSTGNVGIGETTPETTFEVVGTASISGATTLGSTLSITGALTANGGITADSGVFTVTDTTGAIHTGSTLDVDGVITAGSSGITLTGAAGYILEGAITQDSLDDSEIEDNSLTALSLAAGSVTVAGGELDAGYAGAGLAGGGASALAVGAGTCITVNANDVAVTSNCVDSTTLDSVDSGSFLRSDVDDNLTAAIIVPTANRDEGIFGTYDSTKTQHIWSMGTAYRNAADGTTFGNLYGLAYQYGGSAGGHGTYLVQNGTATAGLGTGIWTSGAITGGSTITSSGAITNSAPSQGNISLSGLLPGYADNTYPTLKTSGSYLYFSAGGYYSGYWLNNSFYVNGGSFNGAGTGLTGTAASLNIGGTSNNITAYTINQNVGTANSPTFANVIWSSEAYYTGGGYTRINSNQFYCNNASVCYFNNGGTGDTRVGNTSSTTYLGGTSEIRANSGFVGIGMSVNASVRLNIASVASAYGLYVWDSTGAIADFYTADSGAGYLRAAAWTYGSDRRMKENIEYLNDGLTQIMALKPAKFDYINGDKSQLGFIAQDVQPVIPSAVVVAIPETGMLGLKSDFVIPLLVLAVQNHENRIGQLENKVSSQSTAFESLQAQVASLSLSVDELLLSHTASSSVIVTSGNAVTDVLGTLVNAAMTRVQSLWASGDIIVEGIKKTYYSVTNVFDWEFDLTTMVSNWTSREIAITPNADTETTALFSGNGAQAAGESKLDLAENGTYLATYGVDSARGEVVLSGSSDLINGEAKVYFDFSFTSIISDQIPLKVLVTPTTKMQGQLYVSDKTIYGFVAKGLNGAYDGKFDWLAIARRKGYEGADAPASSSISESQTLTPSPSPSSTPEPTPVPSESPTPTPVETPVSTPEPTPEITPEPTPVPSESPIPTPESTPTPEATPEVTPEPTPEPTPIPSEIPTPTPEPMPEISPVPEV